MSIDAISNLGAFLSGTSPEYGEPNIDPKIL